MQWESYYHLFLAFLAILQGLLFFFFFSPFQTSYLLSQHGHTEQKEGAMGLHSHIISNGVQTIKGRGKTHQGLNLFDKVITVRLSDVLVTHHHDRLDKISYDADGGLIIRLLLLLLLFYHFKQIILYKHIKGRFHKYSNQATFDMT